MPAFTIRSCILVYGVIWTATLGKQLLCKHDIGTVVNQQAVAAKNDSGITEGHLSQKIS